MKLPEGIGFTREDANAGGRDAMYSPCITIETANAKLPALFEEWVKRKGIPVGMTENIQWCTQQRPIKGFVVMVGVMINE